MNSTGKGTVGGQMHRGMKGTVGGQMYSGMKGTVV